jgi:hypothetical protein
VSALTANSRGVVYRPKRKLALGKVSKVSDFDWFLNSVKDQEPYKGKYVAILNGKIISAQATFKEVLEDAVKKSRGQRKPLISFIPNDEGLEV